MTYTPTHRFWDKVQKGDGCWQWVGAIQGAGYGAFWTGPKCKLAHRIAYEHLVELIPDGLVIDHLCRNRACVNPAHMEVVTGRVNTLRGETLAARQVARTHCPRGHPYSGDNLIIRGGKRFCRECQKIHNTTRGRAK